MTKLMTFKYYSNPSPFKLRTLKQAEGVLTKPIRHSELKEALKILDEELKTFRVQSLKLSLM